MKILYIFRAIIVFSFCSIFQSNGLAADSLHKPFWDLIAESKSKHPVILENKALISSQSAEIEMLDWWEDPTIEIATTGRETSESSATSRVESLSIRQRLPFGSQKRRLKPSYQARLDSAQNQLSSAEQKIETELVLKIYQYGRSLEEKKHVKERRERLQSAQKSLSKRKSSSPNYELEKVLILSSIKTSEQQFDMIESEVEQRRGELKKLGIEVSENFSLDWLSPEKLSAFNKKINRDNNKINFSLESYKSNIEAAQKMKDAVSIRPEFDLLLQKDTEHGGAREKNTTIGIGLKIPLFTFLGPQTKIFSSELERAKATYHNQKNQIELEREKTLNSERPITVALSRFQYSNIKHIEKSVSEIEAKVLQGWIQIPQWLEFERQMHNQIEETYTIQIATLEYMLKMCVYFECPIREYLGGSL